MQVSAATAWNEIGMSVGLPDTLKNKQYICRSRFKAARLDEFTQVGPRKFPTCKFTPIKLDASAF